MSGAPAEIWRELSRSRAGVCGMAILGALAAVSAATLAAVPSDTLEGWNDPGGWMAYPKAAMPAWANALQADRVPEHMIIDGRTADRRLDGPLAVASVRHEVDFRYDRFPSDFIYSMRAEYGSSAPLVDLRVVRPDGIELGLLRTSLPHSEGAASHELRMFSTDATVRKNLALASGAFGFDTSGLPAEEVVFSRSGEHAVLQGRYAFVAEVVAPAGPSGPAGAPAVPESRLIVGGKAFGIMGTDELRRDLGVGLLWGTPLALFIGLAVSTGSVAAGLAYGVYAGFKGRATDEAMMRLNDVVYALPALPFLIILAVTVSNSIFVMIGFLMVFGWVGIAKVSRSMALQIKVRGYVDAARAMGQRDSRIVLKHVMPQLLPYAFASVAISVPAAITTEAGLSFLGLGDPTFPTWGQILHDASVHGAASRGMWWWIVPPGMMIAVTGLAFVFIGNALDAVANPRLRR